MLSVVMLRVAFFIVMLNAIVLIGIMLSVVAPLEQIFYARGLGN